MTSPTRERDAWMDGYAAAMTEIGALAKHWRAAHPSQYRYSLPEIAQTLRETIWLASDRLGRSTGRGEGYAKLRAKPCSCSTGRGRDDMSRDDEIQRDQALDGEGEAQ